MRPSVKLFTALTALALLAVACQSVRVTPIREDETGDAAALHGASLGDGAGGEEAAVPTDGSVESAVDGASEAAADADVDADAGADGDADAS